MRQEEIDARDIHDDRDDNPRVETENGENLHRYVLKDGYVGWWIKGCYLGEQEESHLEEAYEMGIKTMESEYPFRRPDEPVIDAYQKGKDDGRNEGYVEGYQDAWERSLAMLRAEVDKMIVPNKGEHGTD